MRVDWRRLAVAAITVLILAVTLTPTGRSGSQAFSFCIGCGWRWLSDGLLNVGLFIPLGVAAGWRARSPWKVILGGALLSTIVELTQTIVPGRDPELADILFNTAGATCGALIGYRPLAWLMPRSRMALRYLTGAIAVVALVIVCSALLLAPAPVAVRGQLAPIASLDDGRARLGINTHGSAPPASLTPLMFYYDSSYTEWLFIGRAGNDAVLRYRSRARVLGLDQPDYVARSVFSTAAADDPMHVELWRESGHWCIRVGDTQNCRLGPTVGRGWAMLFYWDAVGQRRGDVIDACWAAALLLPLGFWTRRRTLAVTLAGALALFAVAPAMLGLLPTTIAEWVGGAIGAAVGYAFSTLLRSRCPSAIS